MKLVSLGLLAKLTEPLVNQSENFGSSYEWATLIGLTFEPDIDRKRKG